MLPELGSALEYSEPAIDSQRRSCHCFVCRSLLCPSSSGDSNLAILLATWPVRPFGVDRKDAVGLMASSWRRVVVGSQQARNNSTAPGSAHCFATNAQEVITPKCNTHCLPGQYIPLSCDMLQLVPQQYSIDSVRCLDSLICI